MLSTANITNIKFDEKLKSIIRKIKEEHTALLNGLGDLAKDQPDKVLRDKIAERFSEFNFIVANKTSFNKPDYFAIFMCLINSKLDTLHAWEDVMDDMDIADGFNHPHLDYTCCCGQSIKQSCLVIYDASSCIVGNCCVEKNLIANTNGRAKEELMLKFKIIVKKQKVQIKKRKEEQKITEFKTNHPNKCYDCRRFCNRKYTRCYGCKSKLEGKIKCDCGSYCDTKFKQCYDCFSKDEPAV